jgi:hypothetical protein
VGRAVVVGEMVDMKVKLRVLVEVDHLKNNVKTHESMSAMSCRLCGCKILESSPPLWP